MILKKVVMRNFNSRGIYAPHPNGVHKEITSDEFSQRYASHGQPMLISFEPDHLSSPQPVTAYGFGFDAWWIVAQAK